MGVDTKDVDAVQSRVTDIYSSLFEDADPYYVPKIFTWFKDIFGGNYQDYRPLDVPYHDFEHTMQGTLCLARLLQGRHKANVSPKISRHGFELGLLAILLHDSGYLCRSEDGEGTGAKYTLVHVNRSVAFAKKLMMEKGYSVADVTAVKHMIQCTALNTKLDQIPFAAEEIRILGLALASSDLLGQMSADDYVDRLPELFAEFRESYEYFGERANHLKYDSVEALMEKTPRFWSEYVKPKLEYGCLGLYKFLADPYPDGCNQYIEKIEENLRKLIQKTAS